MTEQRVAPCAIAIVGIGCQFPGAPDKRTFWANVRDGVDALGDIPPSHFAVDDYFDADPKAPDRIYVRRGGFLEPVAFDALRWGIAPRDIEATDTTQLLGLMVAQAAFDDADYGPGRRPLPQERTSVILGVTGALELVIPLGARLGHPLWRRALQDAGVDEATTQAVIDRIGESYVPWQENSFPGLLGNVAAGRIANRLDLHGTNCVVDAACASSLSAVHLGLLELESHRADVVLAGGLDTFNDIFMYMCFSKTPALSPSGDARPFDADGDGTILGEGLGMVVLKRLEDAVRDGDRIYAVIRGMGTSSDGKGQAIYAPVAEGQARALRRAYADAQVSPREVDLLEAHGTGTKVGDATEVAALREVFGPAHGGDPWCALGSVKSMIGHTKAAAGAAGLIKAALAIYHRTLPPTLKVRRPSPVLEHRDSPFYLAPRKRPWWTGGRPRRAGVSAFGFGGSNFHCILEQHGDSCPDPDWDARIEIFALSGETPQALREKLEALESTDAKATRASFDARQPHRLVFVWRHGEDFEARRAEARESLSRAGEVSSSSHNAFYGRGQAPKVGVLFPGQGAQRVGMLADWATCFPAMTAALEAAGPAIAGRIYPPHRFDPQALAADEAALRATDVAQPALAAVCWGAWRVLGHFGCSPAAFAGHSFGELVALTAAGALPESELPRLARRRGEHMAAAAQAGDGGGMLAVSWTLEALEAWRSEHAPALVLANRNGPRQGVLSGPTAAIEAAEVQLREQGVAWTRLPVGAGFHSPCVAAAAAAWTEDLRGVAWQAEARPVYSSTAASPYPARPHDAAALLGGQLAHPIDFVGVIQRMVADGIGTFIEVGPGRILSGLVRQIVGSEARVWSLDASQGRRSGLEDLALLLTQLAADGHPVRLEAWNQHTEGRDVLPEAATPRLAVPVCGAHPKPALPERPAVQATPPPSRPLTSPVSPPSEPSMTQEPSRLSVPGVASTDPLTALIELQRQTADLHRQFLETQAEATRIFERLWSGAPHTAPRPQPIAAASSRATTAPIVAPAPAPASASSAAWTPAAPPVAVPIAVPSSGSGSGVTPPTTMSARSAIADTVLRVVGEKTGYPIGMLELGMGLDADLGIDSIKRVEILSALQEALPQAPILGSDQLSDLRTLADIVAALAAGGEPDSGATASDATTSSDSDASVPAIETVLLAIVAEKTGYPASMLELTMGLESDLGIDSIKRVEILSALQEALPHAPIVAAEQLGELQTLGDIAAALGGAKPTESPAPARSDTVGAAVTLGAGAPAQSNGADRHAIPATETAAEALTVLYPTLVRWTPHVTGVPQTPEGPWLVVGGLAEDRAVIRAGLEAHGLQTLDDQTVPSADTPLLGGWILLSEPGQRAWVEVEQLQAWLGWFGPHTIAAALVRIDGGLGFRCGSQADPRSGRMAGLLKTLHAERPSLQVRVLDIDPALPLAEVPWVEALVAPGPVERGWDAEGLQIVELSATPAGAVQTAQWIPSTDDVVLLSGGARGVTAAVAEHLASEGVGVLVLLGRTPPPEPEPRWLEALHDEAAIKAVLLQHGGVDATPRAVATACREVLAAREVRHALDRLQGTGAKVLYRSVDLRDRGAVRATIAEVQAEVGSITALVHGAGVLADRLLEDKRAEEVERVVSTKVEGLEHLLEALPADALRAVALFSSSTARFGRRGQADYAMANEALNKFAQRWGAEHPQTRVLAVNWGPWDGGMVTPALRRRFAEEGVTTIPLATGARVLCELLASPGPAEVVVLGPGSVWPTHSTPRWSTVLSRSLQLGEHAVLEDHVLDGRAVLPVALAIEWLAHVALHDHPGMILAGIDDLQVLRGVRCTAEDRLELELAAGPPLSAVGEPQGVLAVSTELRETGASAASQRARILLGSACLTRPAARVGPPPTARGVSPYGQGTLFHGPQWHALTAMGEIEDDGVWGFGMPAPRPDRWMRHPLRRRWIADPWAIDAGLQLAIVWSQRMLSAPCLPSGWGRYRQYVENWGSSSFAVRLQVRDHGQGRLRCDLDWVDESGQLLAQLDGLHSTVDPGLRPAFARSRLPAPGIFVDGSL